MNELDNIITNFQSISNPTEDECLGFLSKMKELNTQDWMMLIPKIFTNSAEFLMKAIDINSHSVYLHMKYYEDEAKPEVYKYLIEKSPGYLANTPEKYISPEICLNATKKEPWTISDIPKHLITSEIAQIAINHSPSLLREVPEKLRTKELCCQAINKKGKVLKYIPLNVIDQRMCEQLINICGSQLEFVPENMRTINLSIKALLNDKNKTTSVGMGSDNYSIKVTKITTKNFTAYKFVTLVNNPDHPTTLNNLLVLKNQEMIKSTINNIREEL